MRAIFLKNIDSFKEQEDVLIDGDNAKHLVKVVRVKKNEQILILNGRGLCARATIKSLDRKSLLINIDSVEMKPRKEILDLAICTPKKDAMEDIIRDCVELGIENLYPLESKYSQYKIEVNERIERIVESGLIQANNPYLLNILPMTLFENLENISNQYEQVIYCSSKKIKSSQIETLKGKTLIIIGPEAGLSEEEELMIERFQNSKAIHFPSYILRAPTAVNVAAGFVFSKLQ